MSSRNRYTKKAFTIFKWFTDESESLDRIFSALLLLLFFLSIFPSESYAREDISIFQSVMDGVTAEDVYIRKRASYRERFNEDLLGL